VRDERDAHKENALTMLVQKVADLIEASVRALAALGSLCAFGIFVSMLIDVIGREVFRASTELAIDLSELLMVPLVFLVIPYVAQIGANVKVDLLINALSAGPRRLFEIVAQLIFLPFAALVGWAGWLSTHDAYRFNSVTEAGVPLWPVLVCIPVGATFLACQIVVNVARDLGNSTSPRAG
jgi:TRAP-type C4-dicarboxylate transport system permease small subunit